MKKAIKQHKKNLIKGSKKLVSGTKKLAKDTHKNSKKIIKKGSKHSKKIAKSTKKIIKKAKKDTKKAFDQTIKGSKIIMYKGEKIIIEYGEKILDASHDKRFKKYFKALSWSVVAVMLFLFIYVFLNYQQFEDAIIQLVGGYGYLAIAITSFVLDMLLIPLGPDLPLSVGILAGYNQYLVLLVATLASSCASLLGYYLGSIYGEKGMIKMYGTLNYKAWSSKFEKYGKWIVALGAISPLPYVPMCWMSGIFNLPLKEFVVFALIPRAIRFCVVLLIITNVLG